MADFDEGDGAATKADIAALKSQARANEQPLRDAYESGLAEGAGSGSKSTSVPIPNASRKVVGLMAIAVIFSLAGEELGKATTSGTGSQAPINQAAGGLTGGAKIILGGTVATAILAGIAEAGNAGQQLAVGIATVAVVASVLVKGKPVWDGINRLFGSSTTTGSTGSTGAPDLSRQAAPNYMGPLPSLPSTVATGPTGG